MLKHADNRSLNLINSLHIKNFRNHENLALMNLNSSVVILGNNGSGKTSILEAISIFSNSRGFRRSKIIEMLNKKNDECIIKIELQVHKIISNELKTIINKENKTRKLFINGNEVKSFEVFRKNIYMLWLTPYTDRIFVGPSSARRNFFDGIVINFDYNHSLRLSEYEKLLKQRSRLLKENYSDENWLNTIEDSLSKLSVIISCSRLDILMKINEILVEPLRNFPDIEIKYINSLENQLLKYPAIEVENKLKNYYYKSREIDKLLGGSQYGCQKSDISIRNLNKNMSARMCSSGEQQAMLISLIISASKALKETVKSAPILLLDEIFIHLDEIRKNSLLNQIEDLQSQAWITTTEKENFLLNKKFCYHYLHNKDLEINEK